MGKSIRIGIENFKTFIDGNYYLVDKTGLIVDLVCLAQSDAKTDEPVRKTKPALNGVTLFLRPRRFGKTLTLSMLKYFFDIDEKENAYLFDGLAISKEKEICAEFQNRFPVIFLTLKDVKGRNEEEFLEAFNDCLKDEYDVPLNTAHQNKCYDYVVDIISAMFSKGLKTNDNLRAGIITGCLLDAKNQIFTGLNNPAICPVTSAKYARYFGFTKDETAELLHTYDLDSRMDDVRDNYDGYNIGKYSIYNPFSLLKFIESARCDHSTVCRNYWAATSGDALLREMLASCKEEKNADLKSTFEKLLTGNPVEKITIDDTIVYATMKESNAAIMGTLLFSGYLTVVRNEGNDIYTLRIPNREVLSTFRTLVDQYNKKESTVPNGLLLDAFVKGNVIQARSFLENSLKTVISYHDKEDFPHGFLLGVLTATVQGPSWIIKSNRETGLGRSDIFLADWKGHEAIIIEVKRAETEGEMERKLAEGLEQIEKNAYDADYDNTFTVRKYCVCFCGKQAKVKMAQET
jgi:hypothetical protein